MENNLMFKCFTLNSTTTGNETSSVTWITYLTRTYGALGIAIYLMVCGTIMLNKKLLKEPYYKIFIILSIMNICTFFNTELALRLPHETRPGDMLAFIFESQYFFGLEIIRAGIQLWAFYQHEMNLIMAFNRVQAVFFSMDPSTFWKYFGIPIGIIALILPLGINYDHLLCFSYYCPFGATFVLRANEPEEEKSILRTGIFTIVCTMASFICHLLVIIKLALRKVRPINDKGIMEKKFIIHSLLQFLVEVVACTTTILLYFRDSYPNLFLTTLAAVPYVSDAMTLLPPIFLLAICKEIRNSILKRFSFCLSKKKTVVVKPLEGQQNSGVSSGVDTSKSR